MPAPTFTRLLVITPEQAVTGVPARVTVEALDQSGHVLRNFTGTVSLATNDPAAPLTGLPATYTFTAPNNGVHTFNVTFGTVDTPASPTTVTATDGAVTDTGSVNVFAATTVTHFAIVNNSFFGATLGTPTPVTVVALNAVNQVVPSYVGTVTLTSSDTLATASATQAGTYTLLSRRGCVYLCLHRFRFRQRQRLYHRFYINFGTAMSQSLTVTDSSLNISATTHIWVSNLPPWWSLGLVVVRKERISHGLTWMKHKNQGSGIRGQQREVSGF